MVITIDIRRLLVTPAGVEPSVSDVKDQRLNHLTKEPYSILFGRATFLHLLLNFEGISCLSNFKKNYKLRKWEPSSPRVGYEPTDLITCLFRYFLIFNSLKLSIYIISKFLRIFNFVFRKREWENLQAPHVLFCCTTNLAVLQVAKGIKPHRTVLQLFYAVTSRQSLPTIKSTL